MQNNPYGQIYQPMYGNPYAARMPQMTPPIYQQQPPQPSQPQQGSLVMVTSRTEAEAAQIPFDGLPHFYANMGAGEVYAKIFNSNTGMADFVVFRVERPQAAAVENTPPPSPEYATRSDLESLEARLMEKIGQARAKHARREEVTDD